MSDTGASLDVVDITKAFGSAVVVDGVHLSVPGGERHGLIGVNGAGKTTLFNMIAGSLVPTAGRILIDGTDVTRLSVRRRVHAGLGRTFQVSTLAPSLTVRENLTLAHADGRLPPLFRPWHRQPGTDRRAQIATELGLDAVMDTPVSELSYGTVRQLELAMVLYQEPRLLLLDEPAAGLSRAERSVFLDIIRNLPRSITLVMIEHDMDIMLDLSDRISVLHQGAIHRTGTPDEIAADPTVRAIYLGQGTEEEAAEEARADA